MIKKTFIWLIGRFWGADFVSRLVRRKKRLSTFIASVVRPYHFESSRYHNSFLMNSSYSEDVSTTQKVSRVIYVFWTGDNEMSANRKRCFEQMQAMAGVPVVLISPNNLKDYILPDHPLHPAYEYLSYVHRSDYLRCYFMNFYGGGYSDIKEMQCSWKPMFDKLDASDAYLIGYKENEIDHVAIWGQEDQNLKQDLYTYWRLLRGNGGYICRSYTKFTDEWFAEVNKRLDDFLPLLKEHPSQIDPYTNTGTGYPITWTEICGSVFHPLCLKYSERLLCGNKMRPSCGGGYR